MLIYNPRFTRPKVLVLLPFRNVAHKFAKQLIKLALPGAKRQVPSTLTV